MSKEHDIAHIAALELRFTLAVPSGGKRPFFSRVWIVHVDVEEADKAPKRKEAER